MGKQYPDNAEYNKLVRDKIVEIIQADGLQTEIKELSSEEVIKELLIKVVEEAKELSGAQNNNEITKEMADVLEVIYELTERLDISLETVEQVRQDRANKRGGFKKGIYLIRTYKEE